MTGEASLYPVAQKILRPLLVTGHRSCTSCALCWLRKAPAMTFCYQFVMGTGCVNLVASSSCYDVLFMHDHENMSRGWKQRPWEPKQLRAGQTFFPSVEQWCRLPKEVVLYQSLEVFKTCLDTAVSNMVWTQSWPFFEKAGLKTSWGFLCILKSWIKTGFLLRNLEAAKQGGGGVGRGDEGEGWWKPHRRTRHLLQPGKMTLLQAPCSPRVEAKSCRLPKHSPFL